MARRISSLFGLNNAAEEKDLRVQVNGLSPSDSAPSRSPNFLRKSMDRSRRSSGQYLTPTDPAQPSLQELKHGLSQDPTFDNVNALPLPPSIATGPNSRSSSFDASSRPGTPSQISRSSTPKLHLPHEPLTHPTSDGGDKLKKKRWGKNGKKEEERGPAAWIVGAGPKIAYDAKGLMDAKPMPELWNELEGNCFVYLFPRTSGKAPSFKIDSALFASSPTLTQLAFGDVYSHPAAANGDHPPHSSPMTPPRSPKHGPVDSVSDSSRDSRGRFSHLSDVPESSLYLPIKLHTDGFVPGPGMPRPDSSAAMEDLQTLIDYRNFFAFLAGQSLVATETRSTLFQIFMCISGILKSFRFGNVDGSTFGEVANASFERYVEELALADVRSSREKTIEGIVLGERMKSVALYNEAFTHGVGKYNDLIGLKNSKFDMISPLTQNRLARAAMDLDKRVASIRVILTHLEFPHVFAGIMTSKTSAERKHGVRFDAWKEGFLGMRKFMLALMKQKYGDWPPKASSKKNTLETSGLNRLVLRDLYHDLTSMYDLLVDRTNLTTRTTDGADLAAHDPGTDIHALTIRGLRSVLSENDRSSPPVKPPIPFDLPRLPTRSRTTSSVRPASSSKPPPDPKSDFKKLKTDDIATILRASWNPDAYVTPFVEVFRDMERRAGHGASVAELVDLRIGAWIFMYACLQALPMLALDAPGLRCTAGVEYFLCEAPRSGVPWAGIDGGSGSGVADGASGGSGAAAASDRKWFAVASANGGVVSLPSDLIEHGVEGIYRRSHCWRVAERWAAENPALNEALREQQQQYRSAGAVRKERRAVSEGEGMLQPESPGGHSGQRQSSLTLGLQALPLPTGVTPDGSAPTMTTDGRGRRTPQQHSVDASKTFDAILGGMGTAKPPTGKKGKK